MCSACQMVHEKIAVLPRFSGSFEECDVPDNGLYFVFEDGEKSHGLERIVRVGTHNGDGNLRSRIREHLYTSKKDRSVFRKHIGRCILAKRNDPFLCWWEKDLTSRKAREMYQHLIDMKKQATIEKEVGEHIARRMSFAVLEVAEKQDRLETEKLLLSTLAQCNGCLPSPDWLGRYHPRKSFRSLGLWNIQGLKGQTLSRSEAERLLPQ